MKNQINTQHWLNAALLLIPLTTPHSSLSTQHSLLLHSALTTQHSPLSTHYSCTKSYLSKKS
ncbi:hypothetical protein [Nostoc sp. CMAA1605]|uniref:hypothetical protein n=1 Tax=Nostoc sp. CMAA1605 TaxID=2055159 RepID=UPI001F47FCDC|nr:hypothetical protein [Nostoc sp. CMAA1605]